MKYDAEFYKQKICPKYAQNAGLNVLKDVWDYNKVIVITFLKKVFHY